MLTFNGREVTSPIGKTLVWAIIGAIIVFFIPLFLLAAIIGLIGWCCGWPVTVKVDGKVRKYRWLKRIA